MLIAVFQHARAVIRAEKCCRDHGVHVTVMPVPETISSECGMCLGVTDSDRALFDELMNKASIAVKLYDNI